MAVVTGASRGLGSGIAQVFAKHGIKVGICARNEPSPQGLQDAVFVSRALDVGEPEEVAQFATAVARELGPIDLWINNAGVIDPIGPFAELDLNDVATNIHTNLLGVFNGSQAFIRHRRDVGPGGVLVNISSGAASNRYRGWSAYSAAKAGVERFTEVIQDEEGPFGLRAFAVSPGVIDTEMQARIRQSTPLQFPQVERFRTLHKEGHLKSPHFVGEQLLQLAFSPADTAHKVCIRLPD